MIARRIADANIRFGKPADWDTVHSDRNCCDLWVRGNGDGTYESAWEPTPDELAALNAGGSIVLRIMGGQPPVLLYATLPRQEETDAA